MIAVFNRENCKGLNGKINPPIKVIKIAIIFIGFGGLGVTCSLQESRFVGSNPAEVDGFFQDVKILSTSPPGGTLSWGFRV